METPERHGTGTPGALGRLRRWLRELVVAAPEEAVPEGTRERYRVFRRILDRNNQILKYIADLEEKSRGDYLFDRSYIQASVEELLAALGEIADDLVAVGGAAYLPLKEKVREISGEILVLLEGRAAAREDHLVRPLAGLGSSDAWSVGAKNAQLAELAARAALPTPDGFAVTAWGYHRFLESAGLEERIEERLRGVDLSSYAGLERASGEIRELVLATPLPPELEDAIRGALDDLAARSGARCVAVRSSAIGEDTSLSFAGQYRSELNVPLEGAVEAYRRVVAGKFTPGAIYYLLSHSLGEADTPMSVGFVEMIDAAAAGVVYTRDPVDAGADVLVIQAVHGLGATLVSGRVSPDVFRVSRRDLEILDCRVVPRPLQLVARPGGGVSEVPVPAGERERPALVPELVRRLAGLALRAEELYGGPRDIEWALDRSGRLVLLQCRPLRTYSRTGDHGSPGLQGLSVLLEGGETAAPGAGAGPVFRVASGADLEAVPPGAVVVTPRPFPGLVSVMGRVAAIVAEVGGSASHMATLAREHGVPALVGVGSTDALAEGAVVTVDATGARVIEGEAEGLVEARRAEHEPLSEEPIYALLRSVLGRIAPLNLVHPSTPDFQIESCRTVHDVTRFAHQRAMEEMFRSARAGRGNRKAGIRLRTEVPLQVSVVHLERDLRPLTHRGTIALERLECPPFEAFWRGMEREGWPSPPPVDARGFLSVMATGMTRGPGAGFLEDSFVLLAEDSMILSLRMGYHFTTVEALATEDPSRNFVRMQYKDGGASIDRRVRRIRLIDRLLRRLGFESATAGDFLDTQLAWVEARRVLAVLHALGRLTILTKQLDMALANDRIAGWYERDLARKLGLGEGRR